MRHLGDITKIDGAAIEPVDCICGGSPCQDLSVANRQRAGLAGERSGLFMEQIRIIKEMREHDRANQHIRPRPRYMVWENVPGAFTSNGGRDFQTVLTEIVRVVRPDAPDVPLPARGGGSTRAASWDTEPTDALFPSAGDYTTHSTGESPSEENASHLLLILEDSVPQKYCLSAKACAGILKRAERRGKELPEPLRAALVAQASMEMSR